MTFKEEITYIILGSTSRDAEVIADKITLKLTKLIDEKIKELEKYLLLSDIGRGYLNALYELKEELEK